MDTAFLKKIIAGFLSEDIGNGDITSEAIFSKSPKTNAVFVAKDSFVVAGMEKVAGLVFTTQNPAITFHAVADGYRAEPGDILLETEGPVIDLLKAERVSLNLVQRLCGIATITALFVEQVRNYDVRLVDTRKTTPGLRILEKYAVRVGGGHNHRYNLSDGILIKDNHIAACGSITRAVQKVRERIPHTMKIEVETTNLDQVQECLDCRVDIIMFDNMPVAAMRKAVELVDGRALTEASGGVNLKNVRKIAATGVNIISVGSLTHSAPAVDISMRLAGDRNQPQ